MKRRKQKIPWIHLVILVVIWLQIIRLIVFLSFEPTPNGGAALMFQNSNHHKGR